MGNNKNEDANARTPYQFELDPEPFNSIASTMYITSNELCHMVNGIFGELFADYEGSTFECNPKVVRVPSITLTFNHGDYSNSDLPVAVMRPDDIAAASNDTLARMRARDFRLKSGDRYHITDDGKDIIRDLLTFDKRRDTDKDGEVKWRNIVSEFIDQRPYGGFGMQQAMPQYTKVMFVDAAKILEKKYGSHLEDGTKVEYNVSAVGNTNFSMSPYQNTTNFLLMVTRVNAKELEDIYRKLNIGYSAAGSSIIRGNR